MHVLILKYFFHKGAVLDGGDIYYIKLVKHPKLSINLPYEKEFNSILEQYYEKELISQYPIRKLNVSLKRAPREEVDEAIKRHKSIIKRGKI